MAGGKRGRGERPSHGAQAGQSGEPPGEGTAPTADPPTSVRAPCPPSLVRDGVSLRCAPPPALLAPGLPVAPARPGPPAQSPPRSGPSGRGHSSSPRLSSVGGLCVPRLRVSSASLAGLRASAPGGGVCVGRRVWWERGKGWREGRRACSIFTRQLLRAAAFKAAPLCRPHSLRPTTGHSQPGSDAAPGGCLPTRPELRGEPDGDPGRGLREQARAWDGRGYSVGSAGGTVPKHPHGVVSRGVTPLLPSEG